MNWSDDWDFCSAAITVADHSHKFSISFEVIHDIRRGTVEYLLDGRRIVMLPGVTWDDEYERKMEESLWPLMTSPMSEKSSTKREP